MLLFMGDIIYLCSLIPHNLVLCLTKLNLLNALIKTDFFVSDFNLGKHLD